MFEKKNALELTTIFSPIVFLILWTVALAKYPVTDLAQLYAILDLALACFVLIFQCVLNPEQVSNIHTVLAIILSVIGHFWFKKVTNFTIFEMPSRKGFNSWLEYPFLIGLFYFQLWFRLIVYSTVFLLFLIALAFTFKKHVSNEDVEIEIGNNFNLELNQKSVSSRMLNHLIPGAPFSYWTNEKDFCAICKSDVVDDFTKLSCGHLFHETCFQMKQTDEGYFRCPLCHQFINLD